MIVSWNWLKEYVRLEMPVEQLAERLMMAGLNLEEIADVEGDIAIDLEVTSNRPDCLCHLGIAREVGVLYSQPVTVPAAEPHAAGPHVSQLTSVTIDSPDLCPRYLARVVRNVKVGPSPHWMQRRLKTLGIACVNNVVDITNYVLMECSQPLHAFDYDKLQGHKIIVRRARPGEKLQAIDHKEYTLSPEMCVIADATHPVAIAGVMGGAETEITAQTRNVLIEVADFTPLSIRGTARKLGLHSDSSYRFERGVNPHQLDWASRRCAELLLDIAGGELCDGVLDVGTPPGSERPRIALRLSQIPRILGIDVPRDEVVRILTALGCQPADDTPAAPARLGRISIGLAVETTASNPTASNPAASVPVARVDVAPMDSATAAGAATETLCFLAPLGRRDLTREIDLIEEVARLHGYDKIPEDVIVPMAVCTPTLRDRVAERVSRVLTGAGFFEAVTVSLVREPMLEMFRPWRQPNGQPWPELKLDHPRWQLENVLRQSLIPNLLAARRHNERHGTYNAQLYETARVFLSSEPSRVDLHPRLLGLVTGSSFAEVKGVLENIVDAVNHRAQLAVQPVDLPSFKPGRGAEVLLNGQRWGWLGEMHDDVLKQLDLQDPATVAEVDLAVLEAVADLTPQFRDLPQFPAIERDLNFLLDEPVTWQELSDVVRSAAGNLLERVSFASQYRGQQIPANKKSYVIRLQYRAPDRTLTTEEVDKLQQAVITSCQQQLAATLR